MEGRRYAYPSASLGFYLSYLLFLDAYSQILEAREITRMDELVKN
jgi:hypothetical protein